MAEVRKNKKNVKYDINDMMDSKEEKKTSKKKSTKNNNTNNKTDSKKVSVEQKKSLWVKFRIFCHGVASEFKKVNWPTKENMIKYSIATIVFVVFLAVFFYIIDVLFALIQTLI